MMKRKTEKKTTYAKHIDVLAFDSYYERPFMMVEGKRKYKVLKMIGDPDQIHDNLNHMLHQLPYDFNLQVFVRNYEVEVTDTIQIPIVAADGLADARNQCMDRLSQFDHTSSAIKHDIYITVSATDSVDNFHEKFKQLIDGLDPFTFEVMEFMDIIHLISEITGKCSDPEVVRKKQIAPCFKVKKTGLDLEDGSQFKAITIQAYPKSIHSSFLSQIMNLSGTMICSTHLKKVQKDKCLSVIDNAGCKDVVYLKNKLLEPEFLFHTTIVIGIIEKTAEEVELILKKIKNICRKYMISVNGLVGQQISAYKTLLPLGSVDISAAKVVEEADTDAVLVKQNDIIKYGCIYGTEKYTDKIVIQDRKKSGFVLADNQQLRQNVIKNEIKNILVMYPEAQIVVIGKEPETYVQDIPNFLIKKCNVQCFAFCNNKILNRIMLKDIFTRLTSRKNSFLSPNYENLYSRIIDYLDFNDGVLDQLQALLEVDGTIEAENLLNKLSDDKLNQYFNQDNVLATDSKITLYDISAEKYPGLAMRSILNHLYNRNNTWIYITDCDFLFYAKDENYLTQYFDESKAIVTATAEPAVLLNNADCVDLIYSSQFINLFGLDIQARNVAASAFGLTKDQINHISNPDLEQGILLLPSGNIEYNFKGL